MCVRRVDQMSGAEHNRSIRCEPMPMGLQVVTSHQTDSIPSDSIWMSGGALPAAERGAATGDFGLEARGDEPGAQARRVRHTLG